MPKLNQTPSVKELIFLKALWAEAPLSMRELHEACQAELDWSFSSSRKTIQRLLEKGLVDTKKSHGVSVYHPAASKVSVLAVLAKDFMGRVFELDNPLPASTFHDSKILSEEDIAELEALLEAEPEE